MIVTYTLARGLQAELWRLVEDEIDRFSKTVTQNWTGAMVGRLNSPKAAQRLHQMFQLTYSPLLLSDGKIEAKRSTVWILVLCPHENAPVKGWLENEFSFHFAGYKFRPFKLEQQFLSPRIGEHAVRRVYQRLGSLNHTIPTVRSILPELKYAAIFGSWLFHALQTLPSKRSARMSLFVPSKEGAFLGVPNYDTQALDLRTYILREQMRPGQIALWTDLMAIWNENNLEYLLPMALLHPDKFAVQYNHAITRIGEVLIRYGDELTLHDAYDTDGTAIPKMKKAG